MFNKYLAYGIVALTVSYFTACGKDDDKETTPATTTTAAAYSDVRTVIAAKCASSGCHSTAGKQSPNLETEAVVKTNAKTAAARVRATGATMMPPTGSTALTDAEKTQLLSYLDAQ